MAEKLDIREMVSTEDLLVSEMVTTEALINVLDRKGIITKAEVLEEIQAVKEKMLKGEIDRIKKR
ncbi:MAG: hypothetical protein AB1401_00705 [Thermodesulfobacteriota bacterium]